MATLRERLIDAAAAITTTSGWSSVTMAGLAAEVGVSRQTVYNEIGTKPALAEAMVLEELARFLNIVDTAFENAPGFPEAIENAVREVLIYARGNALLHAVVSATHGADTELLPLLTTNSDMLLDTAKGVVAAHVGPYVESGLITVPEDELQVGVDVIVRVVLSHVMAPSGTPEGTAADLARMASRALGT